MSAGFRSLKVRAAKAAAVTSTAIIMVAGAASAAQAAEVGGAERSGDASIQACQNVGGGTWCHGTEPTSLGLQRCYSNYVNNNYHSSTAVAGGATSKRYANPGYWSQAAVEGGWAYTCYTYYNPNA